MAYESQIKKLKQDIAQQKEKITKIKEEGIALHYDYHEPGYDSFRVWRRAPYFTTGASQDGADLNYRLAICQSNIDRAIREISSVLDKIDPTRVEKRQNARGIGRAANIWAQNLKNNKESEIKKRGEWEAKEYGTISKDWEIVEKPSVSYHDTDSVFIRNSDVVGNYGENANTKKLRSQYRNLDEFREFYEQTYQDPQIGLYHIRREFPRHVKQHDMSDILRDAHGNVAKIRCSHYNKMGRPIDCDCKYDAKMQTFELSRKMLDLRINEKLTIDESMLEAQRVSAQMRRFEEETLHTI